MVARNPESQQNEPLEEKQKRFQETYNSIKDTDGRFDPGMKKVLDGLDFGKEIKEPLTSYDIATAAESQIKKGFKTSHLSPEEQVAAGELLSRMKDEMGKSGNAKDAIKMYADFRTEIISVIGTGNAKSAKPLKEYADAVKQSQENASEQKKQFDFLEFARTLGSSLVESQKNTSDRLLKQRNDARKRSDILHIGDQQRAQREVMEKWPK